MIIKPEEKVVKIFISQPMKDLTNEEIVEKRKTLYKLAKDHFKHNVKVIDSFFKDAPAKAHPLWYLGESIKLLGEADAIVVAKGYEDYNGCMIEVEVAKRYGIHIIYE